MFRKTARDLAEKNIPKELVQQIVPNQLRTLYWREESENPQNTTVEIWNCGEHTFYLISGDNSKGEWSIADIMLVGEYESLDEATREARASYVLKAEEPEQLQVASQRLKRMIKKN